MTAPRALIALVLTLAAVAPASGRDREAGASDEPGDVQREHARCCKRVARLAPDVDASARRTRERALAAWEAARGEALRVIFDRALYPDEDHGRAGQPLVDEKVAAVRAVAPELDALVRRDIGAVCGLEPAKANELLADALRLEARIGELRARGVDVEVAPLPAAGMRLLAARAGAALEGDRGEPTAWERLLAARVRDVGVLQQNAELGRRAPKEGVAPTRDELEMARLLDEYRQLMGLPALRLDARIVQAARGLASDMTRLGFFSHTSPVPGRETAEARMAAAGYAAPAGENIAEGQGSPQQAHDGWYRSSGHHRNMLSPDLAAVGTGRDGAHWVQDFGAR